MIAADLPYLPSMPKAVVFDMDGTLFDTEAVYHRALLMAAQALGIAMAHDYPLKSVGLHRKATMEVFQRDFSHDAAPWPSAGMPLSLRKKHCLSRSSPARWNCSTC